MIGVSVRARAAPDSFLLVWNKDFYLIFSHTKTTVNVLREGYSLG